MRIAGVELRQVVLPLVSPFRTAAGVEEERRLVLLRVVTDDGVEGWGECAALERPTYTAETVASAAGVLRDHLVPSLLAAGPTQAASVAGTLAWCKGHPMAKAALEMAVLDAELQAAGANLAARIGATATAVPCGVAVGIAPSVDALVAEVAGHVEAGFRRVKLKVQPGWDAEPVAAVRAAFPDLPLQVDANGSYAGVADPLAALAWLDQHGLLLVEQPLADHDLVGHAALAASLDTPVCLDEAVDGPDALESALRLGACDVLNLKPGRVGGILAAVALHDRCRAAGVPVWAGGMLESGLGRAVLVALAALPGCTLVGDVSPSDRWFHDDLTEPHLAEAGLLPVPTAAGIGRTPLPARLAAATRSVELLR